MHALETHLDWWGIRQFTSDETYFQWQRQALSPADLTKLHRQMEQKRRGSTADEISFYDTTAHPDILPVLYSQQYDYYLAIGARVADRIGEARSILDVGCGVGILTTFYARQYPDKTILGIDRSPVSIARAQEQARALGLMNVQFECLDFAQIPPSHQADLILATHALVQAEQDPGVPSRNWKTFGRPSENRQQTDFEQRTGIGAKLDCLCNLLSAQGRMLVCEKTRQLARRIPFQRALAARGLRLTEQPELIRYRLVEEVVDDGPFFVLGKRESHDLQWDELPEPDQGVPFNRTKLMAESTDPDMPLYENHWPSAQRVWEQLHDRHVFRETTQQQADGRQLHVELGRAEEGIYLYCANTLDQRQLVIVEPGRKAMLESYYQEIVNNTLGSSET